MQLALEAVQERGMPVKTAARKHQLPVSPLRTRVKKLKATAADAPAPQTPGAPTQPAPQTVRQHSQMHLDHSDLALLQEWVFLQDDCNVSVTKRSILWKVRDLMVLRGRGDKLGKLGLPSKRWWCQACF